MSNDVNDPKTVFEDPKVQELKYLTIYLSKYSLNSDASIQTFVSSRLSK